MRGWVGYVGYAFKCHAAAPQSWTDRLETFMVNDVAGTTLNEIRLDKDYRTFTDL